VAVSVGTVPVVVTGNGMEKVGSVLVIIAVFLLAFLLPIFVSANEKKNVSNYHIFWHQST